jgi:hypothetical protein
MTIGIATKSTTTETGTASSLTASSSFRAFRISEEKKDKETKSWKMRNGRE